MGVIIAIVDSLSKRDKRFFGPCFSLNSQKYLKTRAHREGFSTLTPQTAVEVVLLALSQKPSELNLLG